MQYSINKKNQQTNYFQTLNSILMQFSIRMGRFELWFYINYMYYLNIFLCGLWIDFCYH